MEFSLNISNENFTLNNSQRCFANDDATYMQKDHHNLFKDNSGQSSLNEWSHLPNMTGISYHYPQNRIPFDVSSSKSIKNTTRHIMNQHEDQKMIKTDLKKNQNMVRRNKPLKKGNIIKGKWDESEDRKLKELVKLYGHKKWGKIAKNLEGRIGKQCRDRWFNHLHPNIKKADWSTEEDQMLIKVHKAIGTKWTKIAQYLPGRSENTIKNHWNTTKRRMQKQYDENADPTANNLLENYIRYIIIFTNDLLKTNETDGKTTNTKDDDNYKNMSYGEMNLNVGARTQTFEPLVDACSTSAYVPRTETFNWEDYTTKFREPMDVTQMMMPGWE